MTAAAGAEAVARRRRRRRHRSAPRHGGRSRASRGAFGFRTRCGRRSPSRATRWRRSWRAAGSSWSSPRLHRPAPCSGAGTWATPSSTRPRGRSRSSSPRRCCRRGAASSSVVLVIALFAGELVWKDREVGAAEIADAAPVPRRRRAARPFPGARRHHRDLPGRVHGRRHPAAGAAGLLQLRARPVPARPLRTEARRLRAPRRARDDDPRAREPQVRRPHRRAAGASASPMPPARCSASGTTC